jgi:hypothetical protein
VHGLCTRIGEHGPAGKGACPGRVGGPAGKGACPGRVGGPAGEHGLCGPGEGRVGGRPEGPILRGYGVVEAAIAIEAHVGL